mgnify:CR=1 FL=1
MADDPKAGTPEATPEVSGSAAGTPAVDPKVSAGGVADDKDARLSKLEADLAAERELRLKHQDKVEAANKILAEQERRKGARSATDNGAPEGNPLAEVTAEDIEELQSLAKSDNKTERAVARAQLAALKAAVLNHELTVKSNIEAAIARQPTGDQKAVREAWESGKYRSVDDAAETVKLQKLSPLQQENEALKKRVEELSKTSGPTPPGTGPRGVGHGGGGGAGDPKTITDSERTRIMADGSDKEKWDLIYAIRKGERRVVSDA